MQAHTQRRTTHAIPRKYVGFPTSQTRISNATTIAVESGGALFVSVRPTSTSAYHLQTLHHELRLYDLDWWKKVFWKKVTAIITTATDTTGGGLTLPKRTGMNSVVEHLLLTIEKECTEISETISLRALHPPPNRLEVSSSASGWQIHHHPTTDLSFFTWTNFSTPRMTEMSSQNLDPTQGGSPVESCAAMYHMMHGDGRVTTVRHWWTDGPKKGGSLHGNVSL